MFPVYLLLGPETGEKSQFIKNIRQELISSLGSTPELHRFYPFETENGEILQVLRNHSLFASHQLVLLSQIETLNASVTAMITSYLEKPSSSSTLILISTETKVPRKFDSLIPKEAKKVFWEMFENKKQEWLISYFRKQQLDITDEAVELILELVENNTADLRITCSQFASYFISRPDSEAEIQGRRTLPEITEKEVEQFIYHSRKENVFSLFAAIAEGSLKRSLEIYRTLLYSGEGEPAPLFAGLLWQFRRLFSFSSLLDEGASESEAFAGASVMGKSARIFGRNNQDIYRSGANLYSLREIGLIIAAIGDYDAAVREYGTAVQSILIEKFLYFCIVTKGRKMRPAADFFTSFNTNSLSLTTFS